MKEMAWKETGAKRFEPFLGQVALQPHHGLAEQPLWDQRPEGVSQQKSQAQGGEPVVGGRRLPPGQESVHWRDPSCDRTEKQGYTSIIFQQFLSNLWGHAKSQ